MSARQARLLALMHTELLKRDLDETLSFFDTNEDGVVSHDELLQVLIHFGMGTPERLLRELAKQLLSGKPHLSTSDLLAHFQARPLHWREASRRDLTRVRTARRCSTARRRAAERAGRACHPTGRASS